MLFVYLCWFLNVIVDLECFDSGYYFLFQATALIPVDVGRQDDLDTYDDVGELDDGDADMGELDQSVAAEQPGADSVTGSSASRSSGYGSPDPTPTRSSTGYHLSRPQTRSYSK